MLIRWKPWVSGDTENVNVKLLRRLARLARDMTKRYHQTGGSKHRRYSIYVRSGFRTYAEQRALYQRFLDYGKPLAARPGTSRHESGNAVDAYINFPAGDQRTINRLYLKKYGLKAPVPGEAWHIEPA